MFLKTTHLECSETRARAADLTSARLGSSNWSEDRCHQRGWKLSKCDRVKAVTNGRKAWWSPIEVAYSIDIDKLSREQRARNSLLSFLEIGRKLNESCSFNRQHSKNRRSCNGCLTFHPTGRAALTVRPLPSVPSVNYIWSQRRMCNVDQCLLLVPTW